MHEPEIPKDGTAAAPSAETTQKSSGALATIVTVLVIAAAATGAYVYFWRTDSHSGDAQASQAESEKRDPNLVKIDASQKNAVTVHTVEMKNFPSEQVCTGRIAFNEDLSTPVAAEFTGRVTKVLSKPGDVVAKGDPLYEIDTPDLVQAETDLITAVANLRKAQNALKLAESSKDIAARNIDISTRNIDIAKRNIELSNLTANLSKINQERQKNLVDDKAVAQKDYEQAQRDMQAALRDTQSAMRDNEQALKDLEQAKKDQKQAESDIEGAQTDIRAGGHIIIAVRDRLKSTFGKSDSEIDTLLQNRVIDRIVKVKSPISGTVTARKIGLGQYIKPDNAEPLFIVTDLSSMWLVADVFEVDAPKIKLGQNVEVTVLALPDETFTAKVSYISPSVSPDTRRVGVRCEIENSRRLLKSEMFASFRIRTSSAEALAVSIDAIVRDGANDVVFVEKSATEYLKRVIERGLTQGQSVQVVKGVTAGERVVEKGAIFLNNSGN